jgi:tetratricopeptide (TPR) repeat protein
VLAFAHFSKGQVGRAIDAAEEGIRVCGRHQFLLMCLGWCYATAGRIAEARQLLEELKTRRSTTYVSAFAVGNIHVSLGEVDQGLEWFAQALEERDILAIVLLGSPFYAPLHPHPAFQALLRKMNLAP